MDNGICMKIKFLGGVQTVTELPMQTFCKYDKLDLTNWVSVHNKKGSGFFNKCLERN